MPLYSAFTCWGHLRYSAAPSRFEVIYRSMRDGQGDAYGPSDVYQEARIYSWARCIAVSDGELERAWNEGRPATAQEFLGELERDYGLAPPPNQTEAERRAQLALQIRIVRGSRKEALDDAFSTLLGSDFVEAVPYKDLLTPPSQWPSSPAMKGNYGARAKWRVYAIAEAMALTGSRNVHIVDLVADQEPLKIDDRLVLDPGNPAMAESVQVVAQLAVPTQDVNGFTTNYVRIVTILPHDAGVVATTAPFPLLTSTQRHILIRVTAACAADAAKRAAIHQLARRILRGVTTWEIQVSSSPIEYLTLDDAVKGRLDMYPMS